MSERRYKNPQVNLRLPEELKEKIANIAKRNKRSSNAEMVEAIEEWVRKDELYNFRSETSLVNPLPDPSIDDIEMVTIPKGNLNQMINDAVESATQAAIHILFDKYDVVRKPVKPNGDNESAE